MEKAKVYTLDELQKLLTNLDNCTSEPRIERMSRVKLPVPKEYGGGWATGSTQEEAVRNLLKRVLELAKTEPEGPTFADCWGKWFSIKMVVNENSDCDEKTYPLSPCTVQTYKRVANDRLLPFFGDIQIRDITPDDIQLFFNSIMHLSKSYAVQCKAVLKGVFDRAERMGYIDKNPMRFSYIRSRKEGEKVVLQDSDLLKVIEQLDKLSGSDYIYTCFLCFTALRRGEILGLKWENVDFESGMIHICNNVVYPDGTNDPVEKEPKDGSYGVVYLHSELLKRIEPYKSSTGYVIRGSQSDSERPISRSSFTKMWYRINKAIDLKGATSHCFRATYASMMNAHCDHVDPKVLQEALRHKTPDLAIKIYTKSNENKTRQAELEYDDWLSSQVKQTL